MKAIELTQEHKDKLLEMCKALFPEDIFSFNNDDGEDGIIDRNFAGDNVPFEKLLSWKDEGSHFHWFEFCMTHLPVELHRYAMHEHNVEPKDALRIITTNLLRFEDFGRYEIHPIDYLYNEFKKLK